MSAVAAQTMGLSRFAERWSHICPRVPTSVYCPGTLTELWTEVWLGYCHSHGPSARSSQDGGSFLSVSSCSELTFSFVAVVGDAIAASSFAGAVITWETVSEESGFPFCGLGS